MGEGMGEGGEEGEGREEGGGGEGMGEGGEGREGGGEKEEGRRVTMIADMFLCFVFHPDQVDWVDAYKGAEGLWLWISLRQE